MNTFSLGTIIDDIMLIVRNNNISESEDLSRAQIASWIMHYRALLIKQKQEQKEFEDSWFDECLTKTIGPKEIVSVDEVEDDDILVKKVVSTDMSDLLSNDPANIVSITDITGCPIQRMHSIRRHFHYFRKYTPKELTWDWKNGEIIIQGNVEYDNFRYVYIKYIFDDQNADSEDDVMIPGWMVPMIKDNIFKNELSFMIKMPSDDDNNSTLDGIKPHGPQDQEK